MDKIGILTFHNADNLGAVLQAYALTSYLNKVMDKDAEIIDYKCINVEKTRYVQSSNPIKRIPMYLYYMIKRNAFDKFRNKYLKISDVEYYQNTITNSNDIYSTFVVGSDQVWNIECSDGDYSYFLDFAYEECKKISYAASIGAISFTDDEVEKINQYIKRFDSISIREKSAIEKLRLKAETPVLPDPVFLLEKKNWLTLAQKIHKKKYVFVYLIQDDVNVIKSATRYAKEYNCSLVINKNSIEFILNNSPCAFLGWIANAEAVFTNSFHGTAFSILFEKSLGADIQLRNGKSNNRIREMLIDAGLEECIISESKYMPSSACSNDWLKKQREKAKEFLTINL